MDVSRCVSAAVSKDGLEFPFSEEVSAWDPEEQVRAQAKFGLPVFLDQTSSELLQHLKTAPPAILVLLSTNYGIQLGDSGQWENQVQVASVQDEASPLRPVSPCSAPPPFPPPMVLHFKMRKSFSFVLMDDALCRVIC